MAEQDNPERIAQSKWPVWFSLGLIVVILAAYLLIPPFRDWAHKAIDILSTGDQQRISQWVEQYGLLGPVVIILGMVLQMFLLVIPSIALMVVAVLAYGGFWGTIISLLAILLASTVGYAIGLKLSEVTVYQLVGQDTAEKVQYYVEEYGIWAVVITRLTPVLSNDAISFVGGLLRMGYWRFIVATLIGTFPLTLLIAWLGRDTQRLETGLWWLTGLSVAAFIAYLVYRKGRGEGR